MAQTVTGLVLTKDGERYLSNCLNSLSFCDKLLVVDSESRDKTRDIAAAHGAAVLVRPWQGPLPQFAFALEQVDTLWVVSLDQDEWLSPELRREMEQLFREPGRLEHLAGYFCSRRSFYFDRYMRHSGWYPDRLLRVYHKERMKVEASGPHYSFRALGPTSTLNGDIVHHPYAGLHEHVAKVNYYTQEAAKDLHAKGRRAGLGSALGHGLARFFKIYVVRRGFLDGRAGLVLAIHGFFYAFHKYARLAELRMQDDAAKHKGQ